MPLENLIKQVKNTVLKTENLAIGYQIKKQKNCIASGINFSLSSGEFIAVLGENGIGKSTLLRTIANIQKPLEGTIFINNTDISKLNNKELSTVLSLVLTEKLPESQLTVFELVALGRQPYTNWMDVLTDKDIEKIDWALEQTETKQLKNQLFNELSDGQLQRVLIARALAQDTDIIILDEPTAHLDIHQTIKTFSLLKKMAEELQKTIIISTHEINLAIQLTDELILLLEEKMYKGKVKELIEKDAFSALFPKEIISFNNKLEQFIVRKNK